MRELVPPKDQEKFCLWSFYSTDYARRVPCSSLGNFYLYLTSPGTSLVKAAALDSTQHYSVDVHVFGPVCDDANSPLAEKEGRLRIEFCLRKADIHDPIIGFTEEEQRQIWEVVRKKGKSINMKLFHAATGLARVA